MAISVTCQCGQRFSAKEALAGRRVKCPKCGGPISIPQAEPLLEDLPTDDPLGQGLDGQVDPFAGGSQSPLGDSGALGDPTAGAWGQSAGAPAAWSTQNARSGTARGQQATAKTGMSRALIIGLACGGGALLLIAVVAVVMILSSPSEDEVVLQADPPGAASDRLANEITAEPTEPQIAASESTDNDTVDTEQISEPVKRNQGKQNTKESRGNKNSSTSGSSSSSEDKNDRANRSKTPGLVGAVQSWLSKSEQSRRGAYAVKDDSLVIYQYSWLSKLLPYVGHQELYEKIDFKRPWTRDPNLQYVATVVPEFQSPADKRKKWSGLDYKGMGLTHFVGLSGVELQRNEVAAKLPRSDPRAGVFGYDEVARQEDITDGTSQTIMIIGNGLLANPWVQGGGATVRGAREPYFDEVTGFGSQGISPRGALSVMADGSIRFIQANVEPAVFRAACTIHGQESVDTSVLGQERESFSMRSR